MTPNPAISNEESSSNGSASPETIALAHWSALRRHIDNWYADFDHGALEMALCSYVSHQFIEDDPVWLFTVGPSSTGKSVISISLSALPKVHIVSELTQTTFLSGFGRGSKGYSLLHRIAPQTDPHAVICFKDFTSFLSEREDSRKKIASQLREIHDGFYAKPVGAQSKTLEWRGKITAIACCTTALERAWAVLRELGDRFLQVRWGRSCGVKQADYAIRQIGYEKRIKEDLQRLTRAFLNPSGMKRAALPDDCKPAAYAAELAARSRAGVIRSPGNHNEIVNISDAEGTSRLVKGMIQLARARATLYRREKASPEDLMAARRAVLDSIPANRLAVIRAIPVNAPIKAAEIEHLTKIPQSTMYYVLEELTAIGIITDAGNASWRFSDEVEPIVSKVFTA